MKLFTVSYEIPPLRAIRSHVVLAENEEKAREVILRFHEGSVIKKVREHDLSRESIVF